MKYRIGIDLDNTIICYDNLIYKVTLEKGYLDTDIKRNKKFIRDKIRLLPQGEEKWQKLQLVIYGARIREAELIDGVGEFFKSRRLQKDKIYIVSHKSKDAGTKSNINLREHALKWMIKNNFFNRKGLRLDPECVFFEDSRQAKIRRIKDLGCTHFIDDLLETFDKNHFQKRRKKYYSIPTTHMRIYQI